MIFSYFNQCTIVSKYSNKKIHQLNNDFYLTLKKSYYFHHFTKKNSHHKRATLSQANVNTFIRPSPPLNKHTHHYTQKKREQNTSTKRLARCPRSLNLKTTLQTTLISQQKFLPAVDFIEYSLLFFYCVYEKISVERCPRLKERIYLYLHLVLVLCWRFLYTYLSFVALVLVFFQIQYSHELVQTWKVLFKGESQFGYCVS